jgi:Synergist-CTERM protein sorting domain-containing protein
MRRLLVVLLVCIIGLLPVAQSDAALFPDTQTNLLAAVTGETGANAHYNAFANVAETEGYKELAIIFRAIGEAEKKHADDEFEVLVSYDNTAVRPVAGPVTTGTTAQNLQTAITGETHEFTIMYPGFIDSADAELEADGRRIFNWASKAEAVHAGLYQELLTNLNSFDRVKFAKIYRCPVCGNIETTLPANCPICGRPASVFVEYNIVTKGGGSGGGCNAGYAILPLLIVPFFIRRK